MDFIKRIQEDETLRREQFPVAAERVYMAHAGVCALPRVVGDALRTYADMAETHMQEADWSMSLVDQTRESAAAIVGAELDEIALMGPTSVGLSLVAGGLDWEAGDEVVGYFDDYPANVYPWTQLDRLGVKYVGLQPECPGVITWELVEQALTERTRLVSLATCHFLSGYRIDVDTIGRNLQERGVLFCLDAIQTVGAFPLSTRYVDFLSTDSHKWMLGPTTAGIFFVKKSRQDLLRPTVVSATTIDSPDYVTQVDGQYSQGARRYEPGTLNLPGLIGLGASLNLLLGIGIENIAERLIELRSAFLEHIRPLGYRLYTEDFDLLATTTDANRSSICTVTHPQKNIQELYEALQAANIVTSQRRNRQGEVFIRFSPHFYNTAEEIDRIVEVLR